MQSCSLFATPWIAVHQDSLSFTISRNLLKFKSIESVMPSNHPILCHPLLLLPSIFSSIRVYSNELALPIRWPKNWSFIFSICPSSEYSELISYRTDWLDLLAVQGTVYVCVCVCVCVTSTSQLFPRIIHIYNCVPRMLWSTVCGHPRLRGLSCCSSSYTGLKKTFKVIAMTRTGVALPGLYSFVPLEPANCTGPIGLQCPSCALDPTLPPAPAPAPPEKWTLRRNRKDTVLGQKPGMPWMMALLRAKGCVLL